MGEFTQSYRGFLKKSLKSDRYYGFDVRALARIEPLLSFLYHEWWKVDLSGLEHLPESGPAVIVGNAAGGFVPWPALMLIYGLMAQKEKPRRVHVLMDIDWIEDERLRAMLVEVGFQPLTSQNMKRLISKGELVAIFPEGAAGACKPYSERYRVMDFDWTKLLPVAEEGTRLFPLATMGCDEALPVGWNLSSLAKFVGLPAFPITPFFPWFPFPANLASLPVKWKMKVMKDQKYKTSQDRDKLEEISKNQARYLEGEIQAELNRMLRARHRNIL